jgi:Putative Actinobacterial Holin-X, holin superfamily III
MADDRMRDDLRDRPIGELLKQLSQETTTLVRQELELAKAETKAELAKVTDAGKAFGAGAFLGYLAVVLPAFAAAWGLAAVIPTGFAFLIVGVVLGAGAAIAFLAGRKRLEDFHPVPEETVETLKEDVEWAKTRKS